MYDVTQMLPEQAEQHDRRVHNVPADVSLGWVPYAVRVRRDGVAEAAFLTEEAFTSWRIRRGLTVSWGPWRDGLRVGECRP